MGNKLIKNQDNYRTIILLGAFFIFLVAYVSLIYWSNLPYKNENNDYYSFISTVNNFNSYNNNSLDLRYFPDKLMLTPHTNLATLLFYNLNIFFNTEIISSSKFIAIFSLVFLFFSMMLFFRCVCNSENSVLISTIFSFIFIPLSNIDRGISPGTYNMWDLVFRAFGYRSISFSIFFILFYFTFKFVNKKDILNCSMIILFSFVLLNIHLQTFLVYLSSVPFIVLSRHTNLKGFSRNFLWISLIILASFILGLSWFFYNWFDLVYGAIIDFQKSPIALGGSDDFYVNDLSFYIGFLSFSLLAFYFWFKERNFFLKTWIVFMIFIITFSLLTPFKLPLFHRFIPFIHLALVAILGNNLKGLSSKKILFLVFVMVIVNLLWLSNGLYLLQQQPDNSRLYYEISNVGIKDQLIFSNPRASNLIQSTSNKVLFIPNGHITNYRLLKDNRDLINNLSSYSQEQLEEYIVSNKIRYLVFESGENNLLKENSSIIGQNIYLGRDYSIFEVNYS